MELIEVEVMRLGLDKASSSYVVILREKDGKRLLPIWIGQAEAESIVIEMSGVKRERPLTHDLCKNLIVGLGGSLRRINITKVQNRTFFAEMQVALSGSMVQIDARPSDSIAIALRFAAPIYAQSSLLTAMLVEDSDGETAISQDFFPHTETGAAESAESLKQYLENLRPEDFGKFNL